jgi:hypothetical protein
MKTRVVPPVVAALLSLGPATSVRVPVPSTQFVGTVPCGAAIRAFVGGLAGGASCASVMLRVDLGVPEGGAPGWSLEAVYGSNMAANVGRMIDGQTITLRGRLEQSGTTYRLTSGNGQSISFRLIAGSLLHLLDERNRPMPGTAGWSYTLNRTDVTDDPGRPEQVIGGSYSLQPRATGSAVLGVYGGRTPCTRILRELRIGLNDGCQRIKWRVTLFQDSVTLQPTRYRIEGSMHHAAREGAWRIVRGTATDPTAIVYLLDGTASEGPLRLLKADDDVLFVLDERGQPLVGTIDFSYTLNRGV